MNSWGFVVTKKGTLGHVLEVSEIPWEFTKKSLLMWATQEKKYAPFYIVMVSLFLIFVAVYDFHSEIYNVFQYNPFFITNIILSPTSVHYTKISLYATE